MKILRKCITPNQEKVNALDVYIRGGDIEQKNETDTAENTTSNCGYGSFNSSDR